VVSTSRVTEPMAWTGTEREANYNNRKALITRVRRLLEALTCAPHGGKQGAQLIKSLPSFLEAACPLSMFHWTRELFIRTRESSWKRSLTDELMAWD
jgi:hypothetical protein